MGQILLAPQKIQSINWLIAKNTVYKLDSYVMHDKLSRGFKKKRPTRESR